VARCQDSVIGDRSPLFRFEHVGVTGNAGPRLADVDAAVPDTGITVVVGPSGSGKSTLLRLCNRLEAPTTGTVRFRGDDVATLDPLALRRRVGMVFQGPTPFAGSVRDNLRVADSDLGDDDAKLVLDRADLAPGFLDRPADELSGGEAQRMCLARTLATAPEVLLMDEPTSSVDARSRRALEDMTQALARDGVPVVWVTHDLPQARRLADEVLVLAGGRVAYAGAPQDAGELLDES
jgi:putative ABC transport system ATP-binding protein